MLGLPRWFEKHRANKREGDVHALDCEAIRGAACSN